MISRIIISSDSGNTSVTGSMTTPSGIVSGAALLVSLASGVINQANATVNGDCEVNGSVLGALVSGAVTVDSVVVLASDCIANIDSPAMDVSGNAVGKSDVSGGIIGTDTNISGICSPPGVATVTGTVSGPAVDVAGAAGLTSDVDAGITIAGAVVAGNAQLVQNPVVTADFNSTSADLSGFISPNYEINGKIQGLLGTLSGAVLPIQNPGVSGAINSTDGVISGLLSGSYACNANLFITGPNFAGSVLLPADTAQYHQQFSDVLNITTQATIDR